MAIRNKAFNKVAALSNKVAEVELSKETVELGIKADIKKAASALKKAVVKGDKFEKARDRANDALDKASGLSGSAETDRLVFNRDAEEALSLSKKATETARTAAKELGVDIKQVDGLDELYSLESQVMNRQDNAKTEMRKVPRNK